MEIQGQAVLLRIFIGESDKLDHRPLHEVIVREAREAGLAGATVFKGVLGYGASTKLRTAKLLDLSADLPMTIEIVDEAERVQAFQCRLSEMFDQANCGGLVTLENIRVVHYLARSGP